jgi:hypothetical protein
VAIKNNDQAFLKALQEVVQNVSKIKISRSQKSRSICLSDAQVLSTFDGV